MSSARHGRARSKPTGTSLRATYRPAGTSFGAFNAHCICGAMLAVAALLLSLPAAAGELWDHPSSDVAVQAVSPAESVTHAPAETGCQLELPSPWADATAVSPTGAFIASAEDATVEVIDVERCRTWGFELSGDVTAMTFLDDAHLVVLEGEARLEILTARGERVARHTLAEPADGRFDILAAADDGRIAVGGYDATVVLQLTGKTGASSSLEVNSQLSVRAPRALALLGDTLVVQDSGTLWRVDIASGEILFVEEDARWERLGPVGMADQRPFAWVGRYDGAIERVELTWGGRRDRLELPDTFEETLALVPLAGGRLAVTTRDHPWVSIIDPSLDGPREIRRLTYGGRTLVASRDGDVLLAAGRVLWDVEQGTALNGSGLHRARVVDAASHRETFVTVDEAGVMVIRRGDAPPRQVLLPADASSVDIGPDGKLVAVGDSLGRVHLYVDGAPQGTAALDVTTHTEVAISPDGSSLVAAPITDRDHGGRIWTLPQLEPTGWLLVDEVRTIRFIDRHAVIADEGGLRVYELETGDRVHEISFYGLVDAVIHDGHRVVAAGVHARGLRLSTPSGAPDADADEMMDVTVDDVADVALSPDGTSVAVWDRERVVVVDTGTGVTLETISDIEGLDQLYWTAAEVLWLVRPGGELDRYEVSVGGGGTPVDPDFDLESLSAGGAGR